MGKYRTCPVLGDLKSENVKNSWIRHRNPTKLSTNDY
jgi:hypothetical protein